MDGFIREVGPVSGALLGIALGACTLALLIRGIRGMRRK